MDGRERFFTILNKGKPDRLPCQVHGWTDYYLNHYLGGIDQFEAYELFNMDPVIYVEPKYIYSEKDLADWQIEQKELGDDSDGNRFWIKIITTPEGNLIQKGTTNELTEWTNEYLVKSEKDFEIWNKYAPIPTKVDWSPVIEAKKKIGDRGIVRCPFFDFGQGAPWQSFCMLYGTQSAIMLMFDKPDWLHYVLESILEKKLKVIKKAGKFELDLVETGGGAGSSTVISPELHREFCLPYDKIQHEAFHKAGTKVVYHLCGGVMPLLEIVIENGTDGLETMTPPGMGGDCDLAEAYKVVSKRLFLIGGFDQQVGFKEGSPEKVKDLVTNCHDDCPDGAYICSPSDLFFHGNPENIQAFVNTVQNCVYR